MDIFSFLNLLIILFLFSFISLYDVDISSKDKIGLRTVFEEYLLSFSLSVILLLFSLLNFNSKLVLLTFFTVYFLFLVKLLNLLNLFETALFDGNESLFFNFVGYTYDFFSTFSLFFFK